MTQDSVTKETAERFRKIFAKIEDHVKHRLVTSREKSMVLTKLEEAEMWLVRALLKEQDGTLPLPQFSVEFKVPDDWSKE